MRAPTLILADTNFLIECCKHKIDIQAELDRICHFPHIIAIVDQTIDELQKLKKDAKTKFAATLALHIVQSFPIQTSQGLSGRLDDVLVVLAEREKAIIATQDKELKKRVKGYVIIIRQSKYLTLLNHNL